MAINSEQKRWSMLALANGPMRTHVFNPATSGLSSIEKITVLLQYGGIAWSDPSPPSGSGKPMLLLGVGFIIPDMAITLAILAILFLHTLGG